MSLVERFNYEVLMNQFQQRPMSGQEREFLLAYARRLSDDRTALKLRVRELEADDRGG